MVGDTYLTALAGRRGKSMDPSLVGLGNASSQIASNKPQDVRSGFMAGASVGSPAGNAALGTKDAAHPGIDSRAGVDGSATAHGEAPGGKGSTSPTAFDWRSPQHGDEHTSPANENQASSPPANWRSPTHGDEHTIAQGEPTGNPLPLAQSGGSGGGELASEIRDWVGDHASQNEYDQLKGMKASTLSSKAKMSALKSKYEPAGSTKNG